MLKVSLALSLLALLSGAAFAEEKSSEGQSTMKIEDAAQKKNQVAGDIDQEITNKKLRAESGSKSKFSLSLNATYLGGGIEEPLAAKRPNLYDRPGTQTVSSMSLGPDVRYRWTKNDSLTFGTSIGLSTPLQGDLSGGKRSQWRVGDPGVGYNRVGKIGSLQSIFSLATSYGTSPESLDVKKTFDLVGSWTLMRSWQSGLSLGLAATAGNTFYSNAAVAGDERSDYEVALYPLMEYEFNDTFSFRTVAATRHVPFLW
ncbi:MAG: hypothetical protein HC902_11985 [Calothrix sp. SM1_5_4]|nr:hypothetical protein [Calothrix sp. SM1_5_4]